MTLSQFRGFSCVGLIQPKSPVNVGSALRACGVYGAAALYYTGQRFSNRRHLVTDTQKHWRHLPLIQVEDLHSIIPFDCVPVAVDLLEGATPLPLYQHPPRAFYIFGPEDGTLGKATTSWCRDTVFIPTQGCMNLAATVNVVLYDRLMKQILSKETQPCK